MNGRCRDRSGNLAKSLAKNGPLPSLEIMRCAGRSIAAHNVDLKRLFEANILTIKQCDIDRRKKLFDNFDGVKSDFR